MAMTKTEQRAIQNVIARLKDSNLGCSFSSIGNLRQRVQELNDRECEVASRLYLDTWVIPALEMLLPGDEHDPKTAVELSRK